MKLSIRQGASGAVVYEKESEVPDLPTQSALFLLRADGKTEQLTPWTPEKLTIRVTP